MCLLRGPSLTGPTRQADVDNYNARARARPKGLNRLANNYVLTIIGHVMLLLLLMFLLYAIVALSTL